MIQETYKISLAPKEDFHNVFQRVETVLEQVRKKPAYQQASCVYAKLLIGQLPLDHAERINAMVWDKLTKAVVAGMSLTLTIQEANERYILLSLCYFDHANVTILRHDGDPAEYESTGRELGQKIAQMQNVKAVEIFSVVLNIDLAPFVMGISEENPSIPFYGSLAGMNHDDESVNNLDSFFDQENINIVFTQKLPIECYVLGNGFYRSGIVMAIFSGEDLHVQVDYLLGWKPLGKEMCFTEVPNANCAATIDGIPAVGIYQKYLNVLPDARFLMNICEFPMLMERDGFTIARTPPIFDTEGRIYFCADIYEGEKFRLSYANTKELLAETRAASKRMQHFQPQALFLIICPSRAIFLGKDTPQELEAYERVQPQLITSHGPGEIYRYQGKGGVLNSFLLAIGMREGSCQKKQSLAIEESDNDMEKSLPLSERLATFLDVTTKELKKSNLELELMAKKAKSANMAKSHFLSNMSHEIRTPINAILGMDEMILREAKDNTILEYAENIRTAGDNLLGIINDILDFSKIESGKLDIIPVEYALSSMLNDLVNMIRNRAEKKGLSFSVHCVPDIPNILYGDEIRIKQVVTNVLTNAVKYTEKGFVTLSVDYGKKDENTILLKVSVKDSGIGIKEEDIKKLFSAFERIEEKRNRTIEGTGLGMNITKNLLTLMDSKLDVESVYGEGSTFSFQLEQKVMNWMPIGDLEEAFQQAFAQRKEYCEKFTAPDANILVVDDTAMNLTVVTYLLKQTRVRIDTAESGQECLDMVRKKKYDLIFLDHRMPEMDGIETLHFMQTLEGNLNRSTPVISLTANAISGAREEYIAAGFKDYLPKPIAGPQLENTLLKYLPPHKVRLHKT